MVSSSNASNILDNTITQSINILNRSIQRCETPITQISGISITGCTNVVIRGVDLEQNGQIKIECAQSTSSSSDIKPQIEINFRMAAEAINQALNLNISSTTAQNITNLMQQLSTEIINTYSSTCLGPVVQKQTIELECASNLGGMITIEQVNFRQTASALTNCVQANNSVNTITTDIKNIIQQQARSVVEPIFTIGSLIIILIIVLLFVFIFLGASIKSIIIFLVIAAVIIGIYLLIAWFLGWWPFLKKQ